MTGLALFQELHKSHLTWQQKVNVLVPFGVLYSVYKVVIVMFSLQFLNRIKCILEVELLELKQSAECSLKTTAVNY